jgi:hypothetical protein
VKIAMAERDRMAKDLRDEGVRPVVVRASLGRRQRPALQEIEDGFARESELAPEERRIEGGVDARVGEGGDRGAGVDGARDPLRAFTGTIGAARREILGSQIFDDLKAGSLVGDDLRNTNRAAEMAVGRDPAAPRSLLVGGIDDADRGSAVGERDAKVAAPPDVAREGLDAERRQSVPKRELG